MDLGKRITVENSVQLPEHYGEPLLSRITYLLHYADIALQFSEIGLLQMQLQTKVNIYAQGYLIFATSDHHITGHYTA